MSLYPTGARVFSKSLGLVAEVQEASWLYLNGIDGGPERRRRRAQYLLAYEQEGRRYDFLTGSSDLCRADFCCDGCGRWLPLSSRFSHGNPNPADEDEYMAFCFLCAGPTAENKAEREREMAAQYG